MIQVTENAKQRIFALIEEQESPQGKKIEGLRLMASGSPPIVEYSLAFVEAGKKDAKDIFVEADGLKIFMEPRYREFLEDVTIDFIQNLQQTGFKVNNPKSSIPSPTPPALEGADLTGPEALAVKRVLDNEINPAVASHGGHISLIGVKDKIAYLRLGGGCQGCGMADVTLKQGVVVAIKKAVPEILDVLDVTDHAGGRNPYFTPGK